MPLQCPVPNSPDELPPRKQDAIHRALLTGLLGNVGVRGDGHEYLGVRGKRFHLFPGSALFRHRPPWVMAAEVVETTRLYARTVAGVHPLWVERAAAHMVKRVLTDPHWRADIGRVLAYEKVTLHGLTLIPRRKVHFGPIEPRQSREIFIHHALVLGEYQTDAPFFVHNRRLVRDVQALEAKARRRDVLVDAKARFTFYDARVPRRVYTTDEFEKWRRVAEKNNPRLLFMCRRDLMLHPALGITEELYPDSITIGGATFPLEYRFELGDRADGITVTIPLAAVNQLPAEPFQWLVPGFRVDLFTALIRTLPKSLRVLFVPVPEHATKAAAELKPSDGPVLDALAHHLGKVSGEAVRASDFQPETLPEHLRMNFRVMDELGKEVAMGRDLPEIRRRLGMQARASFAAAPPPEYHRDGLLRWDFGDLPERVEITHAGMTFNGYPAIVDGGSSVSIRLFDQPDAAAEAMRGGLRRLFMLQVARELEYVERTLPDLDRLCLYYATIGRCDDLRENLLLAIADRAFFDDEAGRGPRTREEFAARAEAGWRRLSAAAGEVSGIVAQALEAYHAMDLQLSNDFPPLWSDSIRDMRDQLAHLVYRGFVVRTPFASLRHVPRYLRGIEIRLKKLANAGLNRDLQAMNEVRPMWDRYKAAALRARERGLRDAALEQYRWMMEELRVSLFAQELKAVGPVSAARLARIWEDVRA
jgi:ATP-dependent helicase HrpA